MYSAPSGLAEVTFESARFALNKSALAACYLGRSGRVEAANLAAMQLGCDVGATPDDLPFADEDKDRFRFAITEMARHASETETILLLRYTGQSRGMPVWINRFQDGLVVMLTHCNWPDSLAPFLRKGYGLTLAEVDVAEALCFGTNVAELGALRNRSIPTIRSHIRSVLAKTGTRSQSDLVRLICCLASMIVSREEALQRLAEHQ
jgi:DNA-binding CsgD family transcriptional regulator